MKRSLFALGVIVALTSSLSGAADAGDIAIIVNKENEVSDLAFRDVVRIFHLDRQYWEGGKRIYLVLRESGAEEKDVILKKVYKMDDEELKKFWLAKLYREEIPAFPKTLGSNESVKRFVSQASNAIGFIDASLADSSVKVLRIDGGLPGEQGYALSSRF